jgi:hypothetical protein
MAEKKAERNKTMKNDRFRIGNKATFLRSCSLVNVVLLSMVMIAVGFVQAGKAAGKKPQVPTYRVEVEFWNRIGDRVLSIGNPTYTDGELNASGQIDVSATILPSAGNLNLTTLYSTFSKGKFTYFSLGRYHFFDFSQPVNTQYPLPTNNGWSGGTIAAGATIGMDPFAADGVTLLPNGFRDVMNFVGEQRLARMKVNFSDESKSSIYTLRFTPNSYPDNNYLLVTYLGGALSCEGSTGSACASWTVEALNGDVDPNQPYCCRVRTLEDTAPLSTGDNSIYYGKFHMPFKITITVLPNQ